MLGFFFFIVSFFRHEREQLREKLAHGFSDRDEAAISSLHHMLSIKALDEGVEGGG